MRYRIEYAKGYCDFALCSGDLIKRLKLLEDGTVTDIRKLYKSGVSDSVMEQYRKHIGKGR